MSNDQGAGLILDRLCELLFIKTIRAAQDIQALDMGFVAAMKDERIHAVLGALHAYPEKPWTLEGMAEVASLSRSAFADRFRKLVGQSPQIYLKNIRLQHALLLLCNSQLNISQIALEVGYSSGSVLNKLLRKTLNKSPSQIRTEAHNH